MLKLNKPFARGAEHQVCIEEGKTMESCKFVYKYPECFWNDSNYISMYENLELLTSLGVSTCKTEVLNPIDIVVDGNHRTVPYVLKQEYVEDPTLSEFDLRNQDINRQLVEYVEISNDLYLSKGQAIDFLGAESIKGLFKFFIDMSEPLKVFNFKVNSQNEIYLLDTGVFCLNSLKPWYRFMIDMMIQLQHYTLFKILEYNGSSNIIKPHINLLNKSIAFSTYAATRALEPFKRY